MCLEYINVCSISLAMFELKKILYNLNFTKKKDWYTIKQIAFFNHFAAVIKSSSQSILFHNNFQYVFSQVNYSCIIFTFIMI